MYRNIWQQNQQSVCSITFLSENGFRIASISGFKIDHYLVTDDFVCSLLKPDSVEIRFMKEDGCSERTCRKMKFRDFQRRMVSPCRHEQKRFAVLDLDVKEFRDIPSLKLSRKVGFEIGHPVALLGYQLEQDNLVLKKGIISSYYRHKDGTNYIQIDCNLSQGNSGSPVIDTEKNEVIGMVGFFLASMTKTYRGLIDIINQNLELLEEIRGRINFFDFDPVQILMTSQSQMKYLLKLLYKRVNFSQGFALEANRIRDFFVENTGETRKEPGSASRS